MKNGLTKYNRNQRYHPRHITAYGSQCQNTQQCKTPENQKTEPAKTRQKDDKRQLYRESKPNNGGPKEQKAKPTTSAWKTPGEFCQMDDSLLIMRPGQHQEEKGQKADHAQPNQQIRP